MEEAIVLTYDISADDFTRAGEASSDVKRKLKQMGVSPDATEKIKMILADVGPGIPDVKLAMQAGYSTAPDEIRSLGFGAGMGLPNMKKYSDSMDIDTRIGEGTTITMVVNL